MKIFALTWRAIKIVAVLLLAVIGFLNAYVALTGREPATETTDQEPKEDQGTIIVQENAVAEPDSLMPEENKTATVGNPNTGPEYVASEINRIKKEADSLFGELLESKETIQASLEFDLMMKTPESGMSEASKKEALKECTYETYKRMRDRIAGLQEQLALLQRRTDYGELRDRKDSGHLILLGRYVEVKLAKAREAAKAQHEWLSFYAEHVEDKNDNAKSKENELLRKWQTLQDELSEILPSSIKEDSVDLYKKGVRYYNGDGVEKDYNYALQCFRAAAEQGNADAQNHVGVMYGRGEGVAQDYAEAVKWYHKAAEQGNATAQYNLAWRYSNGQGVAQDEAEAFRWFLKSAEQGDVDAQNQVGVMYGRGEGVAQDYAEAVKWYRKAAEQGNATAQHNLAWRYHDGQGVAQDYAEAFRWFLKSAEQGNADAQNQVGNMYDEGKGVARDTAEAVRWYEKAAENGNAFAQNNLGCHYYNNKHDYAEAAEWFRKAAEQGNETAKKNLALCQERLVESQRQIDANQQQDGLDQAITALGEFADKAVGKVAEWLSAGNSSSSSSYGSDRYSWESWEEYQKRKDDERRRNAMGDAIMMQYIINGL